MKGRNFNDLPPEIQKKIAKEVFNSIQRGNNSGAFGVELDNTLRGIIGGDVGFLEADIEQIKKIATEGANKKMDDVGEDDYLTKHRKSKVALYEERENHLNKVRKDIGKEKVDDIVQESDKFFEEMRRRIKHLRAIVQQIDLDMKKKLRDVEDSVQFVETDRRMLYNVGGVTAHSTEAWSNEIALIHKGITEAIDSIDMFKAYVPAIIIEFEAHKKESGI